MAKTKTGDRKGALSVPDQFYIESHQDTSLEELAKVLNKPIEAIRSYCKELINKDKPGRKLLDRPAKGVTVMTKGASEVGDEKYRKYVTVEAINQAMADGQHDRARELKARFDEQQAEQKNIIRSKFADKIHYIIDPDDDPNADVY